MRYEVMNKQGTSYMWVCMRFELMNKKLIHKHGQTEDKRMRVSVAANGCA